MNISKPLTESAIRGQIVPLFSRALAGDKARNEIYLANHSLGRPLDRVEEDIRRGLELWYSRMDECWEDGLWPSAIEGFRTGIAKLIGHPDSKCVIPKSSAGAGLRTVLNALLGERAKQDRAHLKVVTTRGEFDSIDFILKQYEAKGLASVNWVEPSRIDRGISLFDEDDIADAIKPGTNLVVVSLTMFTTGQILRRIDEVIAKSHVVGAMVVLDVYHACGVFPIDFMALDADFFIGGSYKYLRGGPGACWMAIHPRVFESGLTPLDTGWFAKRSPFRYERPDPPQFAEGGNAWLESTPAVMAAYQAASGQEFTLAIGVDRLREYNLEQQTFLREALRKSGLNPYEPGDSEDFGGFTVLPHESASEACAALKAAGVNTDSRGGCIRFGPDLLNTFAELERAAQIAGRVVALDI